MLTREKIKIARISKSMGIRAKAAREKIRADFIQKREELRAQLDALPAEATGQREKIAFEVAALTRLLCNPLVNEPRAHLRARMLVLRRQFVPLLPTCCSSIPRRR
jgi:hypothetical protein